MWINVKERNASEKQSMLTQAAQVSKTPSWPRSWANPRLL
jgi:hypothetical protein